MACYNNAIVQQALQSQVDKRKEDMASEVAESAATLQKVAPQILNNFSCKRFDLFYEQYH